MSNIVYITKPQNVNPLRATAFQFSIQKLPHLTFGVQSTEIPPINLGVATQSSGVHDIKIPGETMDYGDLTVNFIVGEDLKNWNSIYFWMLGLGYPEGSKLYREFLNSSINIFSPTELAKGYQDGTLTILDSSNNPKQRFEFIDMFPISLQGLSFDATRSADDTIATVTFAYTYYKISDKSIDEL